MDLIWQISERYKENIGFDDNCENMVAMAFIEMSNCVRKKEILKVLSIVGD